MVLPLVQRGCEPQHYPNVQGELQLLMVDLPEEARTTTTSYRHVVSAASVAWLLGALLECSPLVVGSLCMQAPMLMKLLSCMGLASEQHCLLSLALGRRVTTLRR